MDILYNKKENKFAQFDKTLLGNLLWKEYKKIEFDVNKDFNLSNFADIVFQDFYDVSIYGEDNFTLFHNNRCYEFRFFLKKHTLHIKISADNLLINPYYKEIAYTTPTSEKIKSNNMFSKFTTFFHWCDIIEEYIEFLSDTDEIRNKHIYFEYEGNKNEAFIINPSVSYAPIKIKNMAEKNQVIKNMGFFSIANGYSEGFLTKLKKTNIDYLKKRRISLLDGIINKIK